MRSLLLLFLLPSLAHSQPPVPRLPEEVRAPKQAPVPPQAPPVSGYHEAFRRAELERKHAIIYVGAEVPFSLDLLSGTITIRADDYYKTPGIYVILFDGQRLSKSAHYFGTDWTQAGIQKWLDGRQVSRAASFFETIARREEREVLPVGDVDAWPAKVEKPVGLTLYQRAKYTQILDRVGSFSYANSRIQIVERTQLEDRWQVPGGMAGLNGWRNQFFKVLPRAPRTYKGFVPVFNGSNDQLEQGWRQEYQDGTMFFDLLINSRTGKAFELRKAEKHDGEWRRGVVFRDVEQRPEGYAGLTVTCVSCHSQALSGNYSGPLVSGDDTVFSHKHPQIEE